MSAYVTRRGWIDTFSRRSVSPAIVQIKDIIEFDLNGTPVDPEERRRCISSASFTAVFMKRAGM